jgi:hypothetical protein
VQVAVRPVRVVERAVHVVVHVIAVRNSRVPGFRVSFRARALDRRAGAGTPPAHVQAVLVGVAFVRSVQVAVVEVVRVVAVADGLVAAAVTVAVGVVSVLLAAHLRIVSRRGGAVNRGIIV